MEIYIIRHGEYAVAGNFAGQADGSLTDLGVGQAHAVAQVLLKSRAAPLYASDMRRTEQTAGIIADALSCRIELRRGLREINRGEWEFRDPESPEYAEFKREWDRHEQDLAYPGGECGHDVFVRASGVIAEIVRKISDGPVAVVTHGGVVRSLLAAYSGIGQENCQRVRFESR